MLRTLLLILVSVITPSAIASEVYRCTDAEGRVEFRDVPCAGQSGGRITVQPNVVREIDQRAARAANQALADRAAARLRADEQAARARADGARAPSNARGIEPAGLPWWQQPGPPPDRQVNPPTAEAAPTAPPAAATSAPPIAPPVKPLPVR